MNPNSKEEEENREATATGKAHFEGGGGCGRLLPAEFRSIRLPSPLGILAIAFATVVLIALCLLLPGTQFLQQGIRVETPPSPFAVADERTPQIISIPAPPSMVIFFKNRQFDLAGLRLALEPLDSEDTTIVIRADRQALQERVSEVINIVIEMGFPVILAASAPPSTEGSSKE